MAHLDSQLFSEIRGSIGGLTYTATKQHKIVAKPHQKPSGATQKFWTTTKYLMMVGNWRWVHMFKETRNQWRAAAWHEWELNKYSKTRAASKAYFLQQYCYAARAYILGWIAYDPDVGIPFEWTWGSIFHDPVTPILGPGTGFNVVVWNGTHRDLHLVMQRTVPYLPTKYSIGRRLDPNWHRVELVTVNWGSNVWFSDGEDGAAYWVKVKAISAESPPLITNVLWIRGIAKPFVP